MCRRGNCHDNAVAESFFNLLKREHTRRKVYRTRGEARRGVFDYIEMFYNPTRKHAWNGMLSPVEFERQHNSGRFSSNLLLFRTQPHVRFPCLAPAKPPVGSQAPNRS